jgi:hypothetical protein
MEHPMKAYWINAIDKTITEVEYSGLPDLQRMVGGHIEIAKFWRKTGDVLFVDEEAMIKGSPGWFGIEGVNQPLRGAGGVVVGREHGDDGRTYDPKITLKQLTAEVRFLTDEQVAAWARAHSSEPYVTIADLNTGESEVMARTGAAFGVEPGKKSEAEEA